MQVLDLIEQLLVASKHPDIAAVERYGPGLGPWGQTKETSKVVRRSSALAQVRAEFKRCRDAGLERRHASKLARNRTARPLV